MALTVTRDNTKASAKGGSIFKATQRLSSGAALTSPDTVHDFGEIKDSTYRDKIPVTTVYNEAQDPVYDQTENRDCGFDFTFLQRDKAMLDIVEEVQGNYYLGLKKLSDDSAVGGKTQWVFAFGTIEPNIELKTPGGEIPAKFLGKVSGTAITLTPGELTAWGFTAGQATVTIAATSWRYILEQ
jgi:hypothetical protein